MGLNFKFIVIWKAFSTMSSGPSVPIRTSGLRPFGYAGTKAASAHPAASAAAPVAVPPAAPKTTSSATPKATSSVAHPATPSAAKPAVPKECAEFKAGKACHRGQHCRDEKCRNASKAAASSPKSSGKGGDGGFTAQLAAIEKRMNERFDTMDKRFDTIETKVESGFAAQQAADVRLQQSIEAMMCGIGGLAKTIEKGIVSSKSTAVLPALLPPPAPETHGSARRALPALPAPESSSSLTNFANVATKLKPCPLNDAVKALIPQFVMRYSRTHDSDALACLLLAMLSGKKKSDLNKMGEFTRTRVLPLLTQTNIAIFKRFFEELTSICRPNSCVKVNNSSGVEYKQTFHLLGKEESDICYLIQILLEEV